MSDLETPAQRAARRLAHREFYCRVKCRDCMAPSGTPCSAVRHKELLGGIVHQARSRLAHSVNGWELKR